MTTTPVFLTSAAYDEFVKPGRSVPRSIVEVGNDASRRSEGTRIDLIRHLLTRVQTLAQREGTWFESVCLRVRNGDGMSWSAESVCRALADEYPHFKQWCVSDRTSPDALPTIGGLVGVRMFLRLAAWHKLTKSFVALRWWMTPLLVVATVAVGVTVRLLDGFRKAKAEELTSIPQMLADPTFLAVTASVVLAGLGLKQLTTFLTTRTQSESLRTFREDLEAKERSAEYDSFVEALAGRLAAQPFPRIVVIDNFEALDPTTAKVILRYFQKHAGRATGSELWVVFEHYDGEKFTSRLLDGRALDQRPEVRIYQQVPLTREEKAHLIQLLGRPERAADFGVVKLICHDSDEGAKRWLTVFSEHRLPGHPRPQRYDELDFLSLLSLTAEPGEVFLRTDEIVRTFAQKEGDRAGVLRDLLLGSRLTVDEFRTCLRRIDERFKGTLIFSDEGSGRRVALEAAEALRSMPPGDLPPSGLGHFFWALYWHDRYRSRSRQAFWMRKLAYHALAMDPQSPRMPESGVLLRRAVDILIFTAEGCFKTGVFGEVQGLLRKAVDLLSAESATLDGSERRQLSRRCWEAYWILGDPELLAMASEVCPPTELIEATPAGALERLFLETVPVQAGAAAMRTLADRLSGGAVEVSEAMFDYVCSRSGWLAVTASPQLSGLGVTELLTAALESAAALEDTERRAWERLSRPSGGTIVTDVMTLLTALWTRALHAQGDVLRLLAGGSGVPEDSGAALILSYPGVLHQFSMTELVERSQRAVLIAGELTFGGPTATTRETDFPLAGLASELCVVAIASVVVAAHGWAQKANAAPSQSDMQGISELVVEVNRVLGARLKAPTSEHDLRSSEFSAQIDRLLIGCEIMWRTFDLRQLRNTMSIRRAQFSAVCVEINPKTYATSGKSVQTMECLDDADFFGLMANLVVAQALRNVRSLAEHYIERAGNIALRGRFGSVLRREMSLVVIRRGSVTGLDVTEFVDEVLRERDGTTRGLVHVLKHLAPGAVSGFSLRFLETARRGAQAGLESQCRQALAECVTALPDELRQEVEALIDASLLREQLQGGISVEPGDVLERWRDRRGLWTYPWVLDTLLESGWETPEVLEEAFHVLDHEPSADRFNTYLFLAATLARRDVQRVEEEKEYSKTEQQFPLRYLKAAYPRWELELSPEMNVGICAVLEVLDDPASRPAHRSARIRWEYLKLERDHMQLFPQLLDEGQFFDVFRQYVLAMAAWGLRTDDAGLRDLGIGRGNLNAEQRQHVLREWQAHGGRVPSPWSEMAGQRAISMAFVELGSFLFSPPVAQDTKVADIRKAFNDTARRALPDLLRIVMALQNLPSAFKDLVRRFEDRFRESGGPDA